MTVQVIVQVDRPAAHFGELVTGTVFLNHGTVPPQEQVKELKIRFRGEMVIWKHANGLLSSMLGGGEWSRSFREEKRQEIKVRPPVVVQAPNGTFVQEVRFSLTAPSEGDASFFLPNPQHPDHSTHQSWYLEASVPQGFLGGNSIKGLAPIALVEPFDPATMTRTITDSETKQFLIRGGKIKAQLSVPNCVVHGGIVRSTLHLENSSEVAVSAMHVMLIRKAELKEGLIPIGNTTDLDVLIAEQQLPAVGSGTYNIPLEMQLPEGLELSTLNGKHFSSCLSLKIDLFVDNDKFDVKCKPIYVYPRSERLANGVICPLVPSNERMLQLAVEHLNQQMQEQQQKQSQLQGRYGQYR